MEREIREGTPLQVQDYSPKQYSVGQNVLMTAKVVGSAGAIGGILWALTRMLD